MCIVNYHIIIKPIVIVAQGNFHTWQKEKEKIVLKWRHTLGGYTYWGAIFMRYDWILIALRSARCLPCSFIVRDPNIYIYVYCIYCYITPPGGPRCTTWSLLSV